MIQMSIGNSKLSKNILIWNLPRLLTCPGAGACKDWCYEIKIERRYRVTQPYRQRNLCTSKDPKFARMVVDYLREKKQPYVRIHESGDLYNQKYLNRWKEIARLTPNKQFYCFTKSMHLDLWTNLPPNLQIIQSTGSKWDSKIDWTKATNRVLYKGIQPSASETLCADGGCGDTCSLCINTSNIHLAMPIHR